VEETINEFEDVTTGAIRLLVGVVNTTVGTMGDVIENSASTVNDLLGDPYNVEICGRTRCVEFGAVFCWQPSGKPDEYHGPPTPNRTPSYGGYGYPQIILPITELAGHE
jgi:hypothetical protein